MTRCLIVFNNTSFECNNKFILVVIEVELSQVPRARLRVRSEMSKNEKITHLTFVMSLSISILTSNVNCECRATICAKNRVSICRSSRY